MEPIPRGTRLGRWTVRDELGRGEFGRVYSAVYSADGAGSASYESSSDAGFALKVAPIVGAGATKTKGKMAQSTQAIMLHKEYMLYNVNFKVPGCAHLASLPKDAYGDDGRFRWVAMQRLGSTLAAGIAAAGGAVAWPTVASVAVQALAALRYIHSKGFVYVDVNPGNFLRGRAEDGLADTLFLCDFGLTEVWRGGTGKAATDNGTPLYSSLAATRGAPLCPRNDLESLGYLLAACLGGEAALPWHAEKSLQATNAAKAKVTPAALAAAAAARAPPGSAVAQAPLRRFMEAVAALGPVDVIDYGALSAIFEPHAAAHLGLGTGAVKAAGARPKAAPAAAPAAAASPAAAAAPAPGPKVKPGRRAKAAPAAAAAAAAAVPVPAASPPVPPAKRGAAARGRQAAGKPGKQAAAVIVLSSDSEPSPARAAPAARRTRPSTSPGRTAPAAAPAAAAAGVLRRLRKRAAAAPAPVIIVSDESSGSSSEESSSSDGAAAAGGAGDRKRRRAPVAVPPARPLATRVYIKRGRVGAAPASRSPAARASPAASLPRSGTRSSRSRATTPASAPQASDADPGSSSDDDAAAGEGIVGAVVGVMRSVLGV